MAIGNSAQYLLGIDLGSASLGWALIDAPDCTPRGVVAAGVRIFDPGVDGNIEAGQDESRNKVRRQSKHQRRQFERRSRRLKKLFLHLQNARLLPPVPIGTCSNPSAMRHRVLADLDKELGRRWLKKPISSALVASKATGTYGIAAAAQPALETLTVSSAVAHVLPYLLRAQALDERLECYEIGRALYHLGQRRGFQSNRRTAARDNQQERSKVKQGISELKKQMLAVGARTIGEYFARLNPEQERIRCRWTSRAMFLDEFEQIWTAQAAHHPQVLTAELKALIHRALFHQRPIRWKRSTIGECELEKGRRRAPWACLDAQRFRLLQKVNDLEIENNALERRRLSTEQRANLIDVLETKADQKFSILHKIAGLSKAERFNLERGDEKKIPGNRTASKMRACFGSRWPELTKTEQDQAVEEWRTIEHPQGLARRFESYWKLSAQSAGEIAEREPENGFCKLSRKALSRILPLMEDGMQYAEAVKQIYGSRSQDGPAYALLPPVGRAAPDLRNPAVERALTELRKVVNALIREYGKPAGIRVELARDLKRPRRERERIFKANRQRERERETGAQKILEECGIQNPSREDIEKYLLWKECGGFCPYTGRAIDFSSLFGDAPEFDVEHILPFSRFPDNSFKNKTLCFSHENNVKHGRTPFEAYGAEPQKWREILNRVQSFKNRAKLALFELAETQADQLLAEFSQRQLNDTRYASKAAAQYLGLLYGGRNRDGSRVIGATQGQVTAMLRAAWKLNNILGEGGKTRADHRHHAIDAVVIALTDDGWIKRLSEQAAHNLKRHGRESLRGLQAPWPNFVESIGQVVNALNTSHRPEHKLNGQLHEETFYSPPRNQNGMTDVEGEYVHVRKPLARIAQKEIACIVDPAVRAAVSRRLEELGDIKKLQMSAATGQPLEPPHLVSKAGQKIPIRKVRIRQKLNVIGVGENTRQRYVKLGNNHHAEIIACLNSNGEEKRWEAVMVSRHEALQRKRRGEQIVQRNHGPGKLFKFSLMGGDLVELDDVDQRRTFVVRTLSHSRFALAQATDARTKQEMKEEKKQTRNASVFLEPVVDTLRKLNCSKIMVDLLGSKRYPHD